MNTVQLIGRLTDDITLRQTSNGTSVGTFNLAVDRNFKNAQGEREADFIRCIAWRKTGEILAQYTQKGSRIGVVGRIQTRNYDDSDGKRVYVTEIIVENFDFLDYKNEGQGQPSGQTNYNQQPVQNNYQPQQQQQTQQYNQPQAQQQYSQSNQQQYSQPQQQNYGQPVQVDDEDLPF